MSKTINDLNKSLAETITPSSIGAATDSDLNTVKNNLGTVSNLQTEDKTIVGAINELFQSANNGKELIANAIGSPLSSNDTFSAMSDKINDIKSDLKQVLTNKGINVGGADDITSLLNKVNDLNVVNTPNFAMNYSIGNFTPFKNPNESEFAYKVPVYCNEKVYYMHLAQNVNTTNFSVDLNTMAVTTGLKASDITGYGSNNYRFDTNYCVFGTDIYLIGGKTGVSTTKWNTNWCYNTLNNTWTAKKARPAEVADSDVVRCNNRIYTIDGANNSYYYTPSSNTWTQISVEFYGKILVAKDDNTIYGFNGKNMYILNTQTNTFETKSNVLTFSVSFGSTGVYLKDHIYILQGNYIYRIDPSTGLIDGQSNRLYNTAKMYKYNDTCAIIMDYMGNGWIFEP